MLLIAGWLACGVIAAAIGVHRGDGIRAVPVDILFGPFAFVFQVTSAKKGKSTPKAG